MVLQCKEGGDFKPHPEGIYPGLCVDVIDLGLVETEFQGQKRMVNKLKLVFETQAKGDDGKQCTISKNFTASLHPKAKLAEFLGKWRGRPVTPGESIDLAKLIGANCTLVISHQKNLMGRTYGAIDAISKPTVKLAASGQYDPVAARQRIAEWKAKQGGTAAPQQPVSGKGQNGGAPFQPAAAQPKEPVAAAAAAPAPNFDPEIGF
jgi:RNase P/RNase MRP subunit p29